MNIKPLLYTPGSLTQALRANTPYPVQVNVIREITKTANTQERDILNDGQIWQRDVVLMAPYPVVFARTRVGVQDLHHTLKPLLHLQEQPLGDWMFTQPSLIKTHFEVSEHSLSRDNVYEIEQARIWIQEYFI